MYCIVRNTLGFLCHAKAWRDVTGREIKFKNLDVAKEYDALLQLFKEYKPDTVSEFGGFWTLQEGSCHLRW